MTGIPLLSVLLTFSTLITFAQGENSVSGQKSDPSPSYTLFRSPAVAEEDTVEVSVLSTGKWHRIRVASEGIYKLAFEDIQAMGFTNPAYVRIFGNGGRALPLMNNTDRIRDLAEIPLYMNKGTDGVFGPGDFVLFYAEGPVTWNYNSVSNFFTHEMHPFSSSAYYYVTTGTGPGKRIIDADVVEEPFTHTVTTFTDHVFHEVNRYNFLKSGRQWFGKRLDYEPFDTILSFPNLDPSVPLRIRTNVVSRSANTKTFTIRGNGNLIGTISIPGVNLGNSTGVYAIQDDATFSYASSADQITLNISYNKTVTSDEGFLDYITVNARRELVMQGNAYFFRDPLSAGSGHVARFIIGNAGTGTVVWDLSDMHDVRSLPVQLNGNQLSFTSRADTMAEYAAVNVTGSFPKPVISGPEGETGPVANQNLHGTGPHQMLIVTHPLFIEAADSLAELHRQHDGMTVFVATTEEIYHEFSSGAPDVSAVRDFARLIHSRATHDDDRLKYLMLIGDGSYNNHTRGNGNPNFILTYQSTSSLNASSSYVSDDFFGFMDENEGGADNMESYLLDLGVGRLPVKTAEEAMTVYRKIRNYTLGSEKPDWHNNILFVGDDEDLNLHMTQANGLADWVGERYPQFVVKKVLLDAYKQVSTATGARYPDVNQLIFDRLHKGVLIFNYTGHGGERGLAAEQILMREDLQSLTNKGRLPLFVTATCEFSRFDDMSDEGGVMLESTSAGETSLLNARGGSIGLLSTTRIVYSDRNHYLNQQFYKVAFERDAQGKRYRLGDIIRMTKDSTGVERNKLNFILLGDPAMVLALPEYTVVTDSLNGTAVTMPLDTLKAFSRIRVSGHLENVDQQLLEDFNGVVYPSVYDKEITYVTLSNDGGTAMEFKARDNLIFKGKASVVNGRFSFEFMVPKDISYSYGNGKIVYYAQDDLEGVQGSFEGAQGFFQDFIIGGTWSGAAVDETGPDIDLYLNDDRFNDQGISNPDPVIYARITDESGINTVGNGIGHDITGIIDGDISHPIILNDFFETDLDNFTGGTLTYQMHDLSVGWHSLKIKAWDVFNNSSEQTLSFLVLSPDMLMLANAFNYPNPATTYTWFRFEHNRPDEELTVTVQIFDLTGRLVTTLEEVVSSSGFISTPVYYDLKDQNGNRLRQGIYPYRIQVRNSQGMHAESHEKLVVTGQ